MQNTKFIYRNIFRAVLWLAIFLVGYIVFSRYVKVDFFTWFEPIFSREGLMYTIFLVSEVVVGIIPPEVFMMWALRFVEVHHYVLVVFSLAVISYLAGWLGYYIGRYLNTTRFYRYIRRRFLRKTEERLHQFGLYLIIIASLTPVPFSGVAMLVGSVKFPVQKYLLFSLTRFLRFFIYAWIFWEARALV